MNSSILETGLGLILSEVRYITGYNKARQSMSAFIDQPTMESINKTIDAQLNRSILSTALKLRRIIANDTNSYFSSADAKTVINLFNHASRIHLTDYDKLETTCVGILRIISSLTMLSRNKQQAYIKGDPTALFVDEGGTKTQNDD